MRTSPEVRMGSTTAYEPRSSYPRCQCGSPCGRYRRNPMSASPQSATLSRMTWGLTPTWRNDASCWPQPPGTRGSRRRKTRSPGLTTIKVFSDEKNCTIDQEGNCGNDDSWKIPHVNVTDQRIGPWTGPANIQPGQWCLVWAMPQSALRPEGRRQQGVGYHPHCYRQEDVPCL